MWWIETGYLSVSPHVIHPSLPRLDSVCKWNGLCFRVRAALKESLCTCVSQGDLGPFNPGLQVDVPVWLALNLKQRQKCRIVPPEWMDVGKIHKLVNRIQNTQCYTAMKRHNTHSFPSSGTWVVQVMFVYITVHNVQINWRRCASSRGRRKPLHLLPVLITWSWPSCYLTSEWNQLLSEMRPSLLLSWWQVK